MRKVIYSMMVSLDGFVARPNGDLAWERTLAFLRRSAT